MKTNSLIQEINNRKDVVSFQIETRREYEYSENCESMIRLKAKYDCYNEVLHMISKISDATVVEGKV